MAKAGRPRKEIDKDTFEKLCGIMCTLDEIAAFFDCSDDTIRRFCKREYKKDFDTISKEKQNFGKISLRRSQFQLAKKNVAMNIFLSKNYLGMSDTVQQEVTFDDGFIDALAGTAAEDWKDED